jgi:hypothetical protein
VEVAFDPFMMQERFSSLTYCILFMFDTTRESKGHIPSAGREDTKLPVPNVIEMTDTPRAIIASRSGGEGS